MTLPRPWLGQPLEGGARDVGVALRDQPAWPRGRACQQVLISIRLDSNQAMAVRAFGRVR
jgi:hypothetical protein